MTRLVNDPRRFAADALHGFVAAHADRVMATPGGVVRASAGDQGQVAIVLGGGSGHYPAFAGWVGEGMAHGAVCGNVFASPSASQVYSVVRAADNGGGVLLGFGNYAGDVLHFGQAAERLRAEGIDVRVLPVTDDVASAPADMTGLRRGIAGDLLVFKVAGAAAADGLDLDAVEQAARRANERTRSMGAAFSGCTLPGATAPLFTVPSDVTALGLGIHGEPGIRDVPLGTADATADLLVDAVLAEEPPRAEGGYHGRVALLLNGLGATKHEELFVVFGRVVERLAQAGLTVVAPEVGEHVTSLDMAGLSLSLMFLDDELERWWTAPADTPALRRVAAQEPRRRELVEQAADAATVPGTSESHEWAGRLVGLLEVMAQCALAHEEQLGALDSIAGDGDHGQGMVLGANGGLRAARRAHAAGAGARTVLIEAGAGWSDAAGGTSGALWGAALTAVGGALDDSAAASSARVVAATRAGGQAVTRLGGAVRGDKTMVDALLPFVEGLEAAHRAGVHLPHAWCAAASSATQAAQATADLAARRGRARTHGTSSLGHPDPGATSFALLMSAIGEALTIDSPTGELP
ncbi:dihydroxyacetone kinase family protein [Cellulomonas timonensis]|uniref:dihydroxyacetone kinase family protein n=1 Tax=Cellulomonas timonensis TaxID=1689271 RepID=UPI00082C7B88|nr:dihydroxyacetone kinase family protein [Cellulomonas timonensis]